MSGVSEAPQPATLFDGVSATRRKVLVRPMAGGLALEGETAEILARAELRLVDRGGPRTVLGRFDNADWRLVAEPPLPGEWLEGVAPAGRPSGRALKGWALLGAGLLGLTALLWLKGDAMAGAVAPLVPAAVTEPMGVAFVDQLVGDRRCETPESRAALERLLMRLGPPREVTVTVADYGFANAFAGPGGQIVLTRGLLAQASGADEIAGVLAHELGHVAHHDPTKALVRHYGLSLLAGSLGGGYADAADLGLLLASTRGAERAADSYALAQLKAGGISTAGLVSFFERQQRPAKPASTPAILEAIGSYATTHPPDAERVAAFKAAAGPGRPAMPAADWAAIRAACGAPKARSGD